MGQLPVAPHTQEPDIRTTTPLPSFPSETPAISTRSNLNLVSQSASTLRRSACTAFCSSLVSASLSPAPGQSLHVFRDGEGLRRPRTLRHKAEGNQDHASERAHRKGILAHFGKGCPVRKSRHPPVCYLGRLRNLPRPEDLDGRRLRGRAGRILRMAVLPARWQARHMYQLATVR